MVITELRVMPGKGPAARGGVKISPSTTMKMFSPVPSDT
jgi:hypothetical protein